MTPDEVRAVTFRKAADRAAADTFGRVTFRKAPARHAWRGSRCGRLPAARGPGVASLIGYGSAASNARAHCLITPRRRFESSVSRSASASPRARSSVACTVSRTPGTDSSAPSSSIAS